MYRNYEVVSPSLRGVLTHEVLSYEGLRKPSHILRILDGPAARGAVSRKVEPLSKTDQMVLQEYLNDLYGVFMKKLSLFMVESEMSSYDSVKLQAMLQEIIKVKDLIIKNQKVIEN